MPMNNQQISNKCFSTDDQKELMKYIEENSYMDLSDMDYSIALMNDHELSLCNIELINRATLVRKRLARKKADEEYYKAFLKKMNTDKKKDRERQQLNKTGSFTMCMMSPTTLETSTYRESFNEVLDRFMEKKNVKSYADLCRRSNLNEDTLSRLRNGVFKTPKRDFLFALAIGLKLNMSETEELFNSCGLSTKGCFRKEDEKRERAIEYFIKKGLDIGDINSNLVCMGMTMVGNNAIA